MKIGSSTEKSTMQMCKWLFRSMAVWLLVSCSSLPNAKQTGLASWYGQAFHGRKTANGERYDMRQLTAAHRTLPFGSFVRVRSIETGRTVRVRINDRGPFVSNRIIDLSYAAAAQLGMLKKGEIVVELIPEN